MPANSRKFQAFAFGKKTYSELESFTVSGNSIPCEEVVKLFGVKLGCQLSFNEQISRICQKVARQLNIHNVFQKISNFFTVETKLHVFFNLLSD